MLPHELCIYGQIKKEFSVQVKNKTKCRDLKHELILGTPVLMVANSF
jgi:hypothetical protein